MASRLCLASAAILALFVSPTTWVHAADIKAALKTLQGVGSMAEGNEAAVSAWQTVSQADASQLTTILAALDSAGPLAANYLRAAVDAVAERQLQEGKELPAKELEKFVLATKHAPRGRRLAFEWLTRADPTAPDRLVPGFLHDPSTEFRRDAVARLLEQAAGELKAEDKEAAQKTLLSAFSGARDLDQVKTITEQLKALNQTVDLPKHFGFIVRWKLVGPFDNTGEKGFSVVYPPEEKVDFSAEYEGKPVDGAAPAIKWIDHVTQDDYGTVNLNEALGKANGVLAYAAAEFESEKKQSVEFRLGCICASRLWLNGELLDERNVYHSGSSMDQYVARGTLKPGRNLILLKVCQNEQTESWAQDWSFQLRVCDATGTAILSKERLAKTDPADESAASK